RFTELNVRSGFIMAWRLAACPTRRLPSFLLKATTEGVVLDPSALGMTTGSPPSITATTELVVPRSMPITLLIAHSASLNRHRNQNLRAQPAAIQPEPLDPI